MRQRSYDAATPGRKRLGVVRSPLLLSHEEEREPGIDPAGDGVVRHGDDALMLDPHKDIRLALQAGAGQNVPLPSATTADDVLAKAQEFGYGDRDVAALYEVVAQ